MDNVVIVSILQRRSHLFHVGNHRLDREARATRMQVAQGTTRCIVHNQDWSTLLHRKFENTHNMRMPQTPQGLRLGKETLRASFVEGCVQNLQGGICFEVAVFTKIDLCKAALTKLLNETIVTQMLSRAINHAMLPRTKIALFRRRKNH